MNWREQIETNQEILIGKPVVRGTRLAVEFLLGLRAEGWSDAQILENYPQLTEISLRAVYAFAHECIREESFVARFKAA